MCLISDILLRLVSYKNIDEKKNANMAESNFRYVISEVFLHFMIVLWQVVVTVILFYFTLKFV